jgi:peroxiredoxin
MTEHSLVQQLEAAYLRARSQDVTLEARLRLIADEVRAASAEFAAAVDGFVGRLERARAGEGAPQVGEPMPPFLLPDDEGRLVGLDELLAVSPVAISFHRGHWCPYCRLAVSALAEIQDRTAPARLVSISAETQEYTRRLRAETGARFPMLMDFANGYALSLNLAIWVDEAMSALIAGAGWDVPRYQGHEGWILPIPSVFVVGQDGIIAARHVDPDYRRRMDKEDILAAIRGLAS